MVSKAEHEESVAKAVRKALEARPSFVDCLKAGIINYSALARFLSKEIPVKNAGEAALVSGIKRFKQGIEAFQHDKRMRRLVAESTIELRPDVAVLTLPKEADWRSLEKKLRAHHVVEGPNNTIIVVDERALAGGDLVMPGVDVRRGLAAITIKSTPEFVSTPGSMLYFMSPISVHGINLEEVMSCYTDKIMLFKLEDAQRAFSLLNGLITDSRAEIALRAKPI